MNDSPGNARSTPRAVSGGAPGVGVASGGVAAGAGDGVGTARGVDGAAVAVGSGARVAGTGVAPWPSPVHDHAASARIRLIQAYRDLSATVGPTPPRPPAGPTNRETSMINGMDHTGFVVRDLDKSTAFYRDVIGLRVVTSRERQGPPISRMLGYDDVHIKVRLLNAGDGHLLELIQYVNPPGGERPSDDRNTLGASHLAFSVDDIQAAFRHVVDNGAREISPPVELQPGRTACYLQDPDGNWIELIQSDE